MAKDEAALVARTRAGDPNAFERLVERHSALVRSLAALYVGSGDAADAAQDVWLAVNCKLWQLEEEGNFVAWLRVVTFHSCVNYRKIRAQRRNREVQLAPEDWFCLAECVADDSEDTLAHAIEGAELQRYISSALDSLPATYGLVARLRLMHGLSYAEVAATTGLPLSTVKWRLHEGKRFLRERLADAVRRGSAWR